MAACVRTVRRGAGLALGLVLGLVLLAGLGGCWEPAKDTHPDQLVTKRRALFKQYTRAMEPIGLIANGRREYKPEELQALVSDLAKLADKPWVYFTPDGNYPPTHAKPAVWSQPEDFKRAREDYQARVQALVQAAQGGQLPAIAQAVDAVNASCKACHKDFRYE